MRSGEEIMESLVKALERELKLLQNAELMAFLVDYSNNSDRITRCIADKDEWFSFCERKSIDISSKGLADILDDIFERIITCDLRPGEFKAITKYMTEPAKIYYSSVINKGADTTVDLAKRLQLNHRMFILAICDRIRFENKHVNR